MFQFPGFASFSYVFTKRYLLMQVGFPIRKSVLQMSFIDWAQLIAD